MELQLQVGKQAPFWLLKDSHFSRTMAVLLVQAHLFMDCCGSFADL